MLTFTLVTDAASPSGRREAASLAARGKNLVLLGEMGAMLAEVASELRVLHETDVRTLTVDLTDADATEQILAWLRRTAIRLDGVVCVRGTDPDPVRAQQLRRRLSELEEALSATLESQGLGFVWRVDGSSLPRRSSMPPAQRERKRKTTSRGFNDPST